MPDRNAAEPRDRSPWPRGAALVVAAAFFIESLDATILTVAAPAIGTDFGIPSADLGISMTAYLAAVAAFIPASGWAADRYGSRRIFSAALIAFAAASLCCALSHDLLTLTLSRIAQGIAGSMMVPVGRLIVLRVTAQRDLIRAIAYLTWPALAAPVIAPLVGGAITQYASWEWIFLINIPIVAVLLFLALRVLPRDAPAAQRSLDRPGLLLMTITVISLVLGLDYLASPESQTPALILLLSAVLSGAPAVLRLLRAKNPLLDLTVFRFPTFRIGNTSGVAYRTAVSAAPFVLVLFFQDGLGWSPVAAGSMIAWLFVGNLGVKPLTTLMLRRMGFIPVIFFASIGGGLLLVALALFSSQAPIAILSALLVLSGALRSIGFSAYGTLQFADLPRADLRDANTLSAALMQMATALGIAAAALLIRWYGSVPDTWTDAEGLLPYRFTLYSLALITVLSALGTLRLPSGAASEVRRRAE